MKTILTKKELRQVKGGIDDDVYMRTVKCTRGFSGEYDTCCDSEADISGQACCERKHCSSSVFLYVVTGPGNCVDSPVSDICS